MELTVDSRFSSFPNVVDKERRLRVGFVSGDFRRHSVSYFIRGPLSYLNRTKVEAWAYFNHSREDERTQELAVIRGVAKYSRIGRQGGGGNRSS